MMVHRHDVTQSGMRKGWVPILKVLLLLVLVHWLKSSTTKDFPWTDGQIESYFNNTDSTEVFYVAAKTLGFMLAFSRMLFSKIFQTTMMIT